jgi:hypothetical protein
VDAGALNCVRHKPGTKPDAIMPRFLEILTREEHIELIVDELCFLAFLLGHYYIDEARHRTKVLIYAKRN